MLLLIIITQEGKEVENDMKKLLIKANTLKRFSNKFRASLKSNSIYSASNISDMFLQIMDALKLHDNAFYLIDKNRNSSDYHTLPNGITKIGNYAFYECRNLALTSLPEGITSIGAYAFSNCRNLTLTSLPEGITSIGDRAFYGCSGLTNITFKGTPNSINSGTFRNCTNLTTINVPWAEGEVANAPWGATNATINYEYTGE